MDLNSLIAHYYYHKNDWQEYGFYIVQLRVWGGEEDDTRNNEILDWCRQTYGPEGHQPDIFHTRWEQHLRSGRIHLAYEEDLSMFLLKWG